MRSGILVEVSLSEFGHDNHFGTLESLIPIRVDADSLGFRIPRFSDSMPLWRFSPKDASDEHGDPNHPPGPDSAGASEFCRQVWRWGAGSPPSGPRVGAGRPVARRSSRAERHGSANAE